MFKKLINNLLWCLSPEGRQTICYEVEHLILNRKIPLSERPHGYVAVLKKLCKKYPVSKQAIARKKRQEEFKLSLIRKGKWLKEFDDED
jgi:hypothetical protein